MENTETGNEIALVARSAEVVAAADASFMPVMTIETAVQRWNTIRAFVSNILTDGQDFGTIPGCGPKPTLLKPGAEKLTTFFGLVPEFEILENIKQWDADPPFFHFEIKCRLLRNGEVRGEGMGSCNSRESKFRYRQAERTCPACGKPAIINNKYGKKEYVDGFICFKKKGGCGKEFTKSDPRMKQETGRVLNPDLADQVNAILKVAKKRAHVDAVLNTTGASQFFTQDVEDAPPPRDPESGDPDSSSQGPQQAAAGTRAPDPAEDERFLDDIAAPPIPPPKKIDPQALERACGEQRELLPAQYDCVYTNWLSKWRIQQPSQFTDHKIATEAYLDLKSMVKATLDGIERNKRQAQAERTQPGLQPVTQASVDKLFDTAREPEAAPYGVD